MYENDDYEQVYFTRQKPLDEYVFDVMQDTYERKLNRMIDKRGAPKPKSINEEMREIMCSSRSGKKKGYFK
ncbi:MAG: hypothetical protein ACRC5M_04640 [Anaeroplasmataceae bacterium]